MEWGVVQLSDEPFRISCGEAVVAIKRSKDEVWVSHIYQREEATGSEEIPTTKWSRWSFSRELESINIRPAFPDKPVVVTAEQPFTLLPGVRSRIYVRVPLSIELLSGKRNARLLSHIPSVVLSHTWFGTPVEGQLCYWISTSARREAISDPLRPYLILCPVMLINQSEEELLVDKFCLQVDGLPIFSSAEQLWASETNIAYKGGQEISAITIATSAPKEAGDSELLVEARHPLKKNFSVRTFLSF